MTNSTTFKVISLGKFTDLNQNENNNFVDQAGLLQGQTFGGPNAPLYNALNTFRPTENGFAGGPRNDAYDIKTTGNNPDQFSINGGGVFNFDSFVGITTTLTYIDGTTQTITGRVFQSADGSLWLAPPLSRQGQTDLAGLETKPIMSLTFGQVQYTTDSMEATRLQWNPQQVIEGTNEGDRMQVGYADRVSADEVRAVMNNDGNFIVSGGGNDTVSAGHGNDTIYAGTGDDQVGGGQGNDLIYGEDGNDTLWGNEGNDTLYGEGGNDDLRGGTGNDQLFGGAGNDTLRGDSGADTLDGGTGNNTISYETDTTGVNVNLQTNTASGGDAQGDVISNFQNIIGGSGNDRLALSDTAGRVDAGAGNDTVLGGAGDDTLNGGAGNDNIFGGDGNDSISGGDGNDTLQGGAGIDTLTGGAGVNTFIYSGTGDFITDFGSDNAPGATEDKDPTNNDNIDLSSVYNATTLAAWNAANPNQQYTHALGWMRADQADGVLNQANGLRIWNNGAAVGASQLNFYTTNVMCFASGTLIRTPQGDVEVQDLAQGDLVTTVDAGAQPVLWIGHRTLSAADLEAAPHLRPVRIPAGALGGGLPNRDLTVSPQHRVMVRSQIARRMFGQDEVLVAAKHLVGTGGIAVVEDAVGVDYWHFMFDSHQVVYSEGATTESLFTGPEALKAVSEEGRREILQLLPQLQDATFAPARPLVGGRQGRTLAGRHNRNRTALYAS